MRPDALDFLDSAAPGARAFRLETSGAALASSAALPRRARSAGRLRGVVPLKAATALQVAASQGAAAALRAEGSNTLRIRKEPSSPAPLVDALHADLDEFERFQCKLDALFGPSDLMRTVDHEFDRWTRHERARVRTLHQSKTLQRQAGLVAASSKSIDDRSLSDVHAVVGGSGAAFLRSSVAVNAELSRAQGVASSVGDLAYPGDEQPPRFHLRKTLEPALWPSAAERLEFYGEVPRGGSAHNDARNRSTLTMDAFRVSRPDAATLRDSAVDGEAPRGKRTYPVANRHTHRLE